MYIINTRPKSISMFFMFENEVNNGWLIGCALSPVSDLNGGTNRNRTGFFFARKQMDSGFHIE